MVLMLMLFQIEKSKIVAVVFCLLVECDAKRMDFYGFINYNPAVTLKLLNFVNLKKR